mmetsp:Transcript_22601/g.72352  ORF Transcript_22601/g.72352 Transcript_22601/m.72352 type:complete len:404 (-) Transcript_22601:340-1551(-)
MGPELFQRYRLVGKIGEGTYGVVYKAKKYSSNFLEEPGDFAIKKIKPSNNEIERPSVTSISTLREVSLLRELSHENIVNLTEVVIDPRERDVALVMEFAELTLESVLKEHRKGQEKLPDYCCKAMLYQCLKGLEYMHENWVLHRDLKPQNILIIGEGPKRGNLQLADLGLARIFRAPLRPLGNVDKTVVTLWYRAPELLLGTNHYTTAVDIWSMGCIFAELFFAHNPRAPPALFAGKQANQDTKIIFEEHQCKQVFSVLGVPSNITWPDVEEMPNYKKLQNLASQNEHMFPKNSILMERINDYARNSVSRAAMDLLSEMLDLNPATRITAKKALKHKYFEMFNERNVNPQNALDDPVDPNRRRREYKAAVAAPLSPSESKLNASLMARQMHQQQNKRPRYHNM